MRITPYEGQDSLEDIESLSILIKAVPFEDGYAPAFVLMCPYEDYPITIEEAGCLMDGLEIANERVDEIISFILQNTIENRTQGTNSLSDEDEDEDGGEEDYTG